MSGAIVKSVIENTKIKFKVAKRLATSTCFLSIISIGCGGFTSSATLSKDRPMNIKHQAPKSAFDNLSKPGPMQTLTVKGVRIAYFDSGPQNTVGAPIILLHGLGEHAGYWHENTPTLISARRRVIVPDLAGHGRSDKGQHSYSMAWQASLIHDLLSQLKVTQPVVLVGHSMGGHIALRFSKSYPSLVRKLILLSPAGIERFSAEEAAWLSKVSTSAALASRGKADLRAHFKRNIFGRWGPVAEEHLQERFTLNTDPQFMSYIHAVVASINGMLNDQIAYELDQINVPTYLLFGAEDRLIPNPYLHGGRAKDIIKLAQKHLSHLEEVKLLPKIGHMPQIEAPRQVERFILQADRFQAKEKAQPKVKPTDDENQQTSSQQTSSQQAKSHGKLRPQKGLFMKSTLIKRYPNRRLYDTERSTYITLDDLAEDLARGAKIKVIDSKSEADITQRVMLQAMLTDKHAHKLNCLPVDFLRTILQLEDPTMRSMFNHYVRVTLSSFSMAQSAMQQNLDLVKKLAPRPTDFLQGLASIIKPPSDRS